MWFITYDDSHSNRKFVDKIFHNKMDAFKFTNEHLRGQSYSQILINNGDVTLISPNIKIGASLKLKSDGSISTYGVINDISEYLVSIAKPDGDIVEFTKSRINKEYINGVLSV